MKVRVILTDLNCIIEGESAVFGGGSQGDNLERKGLGFWVKDWVQCTDEGKGSPHLKSEVFVPWTSALYVERFFNKSGT